LSLFPSYAKVKGKENLGFVYMMTQ